MVHKKIEKAKIINPSNLNVNIEELVHIRAKMKASILGINLADFVNRVLNNNTQDIHVDTIRNKRSNL